MCVGELEPKVLEKNKLHAVLSATLAELAGVALETLLGW